MGKVIHIADHLQAQANEWDAVIAQDVLELEAMVDAYNNAPTSCEVPILSIVPNKET